jgi:hypothetical protein
MVSRAGTIDLDQADQIADEASAVAISFSPVGIGAGSSTTRPCRCVVIGAA